MTFYEQMFDIDIALAGPDHFLGNINYHPGSGQLYWIYYTSGYFDV